MVTATIFLEMLDSALIKDKIQEVISSRGCFLVDVEVSRDNDVTITIESAEGTVQMDDCVAVDKVFHEIFNQDEEDYSLTVTSAGLDMPFKVPGQYEKALGSDVEVKFKGGKKLIATLTAYDGESITLRFNAKESVEGSKKKVLVEHKDTFPLAEINSVMPHITFE